MFIDNIIPSPALLDFIRIYRIIDFYFPEGQPLFPKLYTPRPEICLQFYAKEIEKLQFPGDSTSSKSKPISLFGQYTQTHSRFVGKDFLVFQVIFQPSAFYQLTGIPASQLTDTLLDATAIFGNNIHYVNEQLYHAGDYRQMIVIVEKFLSGCIRKNTKYQHPVYQAAKLMIKDADSYTLDWYMRETCLCQRQFDRKFTELLGINPKKFLRVIRFDKAFRMKNRFPEKDWLSIAIHCGYHDYQHLSKDYLSFTGLSPVQFTLLEEKGPDHILGIAEI